MMFAAAGLVFGFVLNFAGMFIFFERRIASRMQSRVGPNRVGPQGLLQFMVDGLKCLFKEDLVPKDADQILFRSAPYFVVLGMTLAFAALPFSSALIASDINIGLLFVLGVTSLVVIGLLLGGWGSNSKWALLGGMRSAAQVVSYEIPAGIAAMCVIVIGGSLSMQDLIKVQAGAPWNWTIFHSPFVAASFFIFFIASLAEGNRTPFDLPEAESELVSGYNTEYSGMRFLMFFLGEFANVWIMCAVPVVLYLGGWQIPWGTTEAGVVQPWLLSAAGVILFVMLIGAAAPAVAIAVQIARYRQPAQRAIDKAEIPGSPKQVQVVRLALKGGVDGAIALHGGGALLLVLAALGQFMLKDPELLKVRDVISIQGLEFGIFMAKTLVLVFIVIQLRWTLPRLRVDQMMTLCWKYLVPLSFVCVLGTLLWELITFSVPALGVLVRLAMMVAFAFAIVAYVKRTRSSYERDKESFEGYKGQPLYYPPWRLP
jgi:NADH:ubiquinone oxidoreductase subunit H